MVVQMVSRDIPDVYVLYGGPKSFSPNQTKSVTDALESIMPRDYNNDGDKCAEFVNILLMTDEQLKNNDTLYNSDTIRKNKSDFLSNLYAGDSVICIIDPEQYKSLGDDGFCKLSDIFDGNVPDNAYDEYAVYLKDTKFAQFFTAMSVFPDDTLICARVYTNLSKIRLDNSKTEENYNNQIDMFRAILSFDFPEGYFPENAEGLQDGEHTDTSAQTLETVE